MWQSSVTITMTLRYQRNQKDASKSTLLQLETDLAQHGIFLGNSGQLEECYTPQIKNLNKKAYKCISDTQHQMSYRMRKSQKSNFITLRALYCEIFNEPERSKNITPIELLTTLLAALLSGFECRWCVKEVYVYVEPSSYRFEYSCGDKCPDTIVDDLFDSYKIVLLPTTRQVRRYNDTLPDWSKTDMKQVVQISKLLKDKLQTSSFAWEPISFPEILYNLATYKDTKFEMDVLLKPGIIFLALLCLDGRALFIPSTDEVRIKFYLALN